MRHSVAMLALAALLVACSANFTGPSKPGAALALYTARLAGVTVEDVLSGAFPAAGSCPMCGRVTEAT